MVSENICKVKLVINNDGDLDIIDETDYSDCTQEHAILERVILRDSDSKWEAGGDVKDLIHSDDPVVLKNDHTVDLVYDGRYLYQKIVIPATHSETPEGTNYCWYDCDANVVYYREQESGTGVEVTDFDELYDFVSNNHPNNTKWCATEFFSIYNLVKCFVYSEANKIDDFVKNGCGELCKPDDKLDMLVSLLTILNYLIKIHDFDRASILLNRVNVCGGFCKDFAKNIKGCGCGKA